MGREVEAHLGQLGRVLYGDRSISIQLAIKLQDALGVPVEAWAQEPTKPFKPPGAVAAAQATA